MSDFPALLDRIACNPYGDDAFVDAVGELEPALRDALLGRDAAGLVAELHGRRVMACMIMAPDENAPEEPVRPQEDEPGAPDTETPAD